MAGESRFEGIKAPSNAARRAANPEIEVAPIVLPCHDRSRLMNRRRLFWPIAVWYCSAILMADSIASDPLLLKVNFGAGHGGASGRYDALHETAFDYAFMLWQMGIAD